MMAGTNRGVDCADLVMFVDMMRDEQGRLDWLKVGLGWVMMYLHGKRYHGEK